MNSIYALIIISSWVVVSISYFIIITIFIIIIKAGRHKLSFFLFCNPHDRTTEHMYFFILDYVAEKA